jgi:putative sporulation protein YtaF
MADSGITFYLLAKRPRAKVLHKQSLVILLLALSCNLDNIAIGISYGIRNIRLPWLSNLLIAFLTAAGTGLFIVFGQRIITYLSPKIAVLSASLILIAMGLWVLGQEFLSHFSPSSDSDLAAPTSPSVSTTDSPPVCLWQQMTHILKDPSFADKDSSGHIDLKESLLLSLALMLNNIPNGLGAGLLGLPSFFTALIVGLLSIITFLVGIGFGKNFGQRWLGQWAGTVAGCLLIILGVMGIFLD